MFFKQTANSSEHAASTQLAPKPQEQDRETSERPSHSAANLFRLTSPAPPARTDFPTLSPRDARRLQHTLGNHATVRLLSGMVQRRALEVSRPGDPYEREADRVAEHVLRMPDPAAARTLQREAVSEEEEEEKVQTKPLPVLLRKEEGEEEEEEEKVQPKLSVEASQGGGRVEAGANIKGRLRAGRGGGIPLPPEVRAFMEPRFAADFSRVRAHTDADAARMSRELSAQAFTHKEDIYFASGKSPANDALTAHELTHVLQQTGGPRPRHARPQSGEAAHVPAVQRVVEIRPPGRGEATAFDRRQEFIDRLNAMSRAVRYRLEDVTPPGRRPREAIRADVIDPANLTEFDRQMIDFTTTRAEVVPMRFITSAGRVDGGALLVDSFNLAYVDLDDMLASDDISFQMNLVHLLIERFSTRNYERRIGTRGMPGFGPAFDRAHAAGIDAEVALLRDVLDDPTIRFTSEFIRPGNTRVFMFRSDEGYVVHHIFRRERRREVGGDLRVLTADGRRIPLEDFMAERAAARAAAGGAAGAAAGAGGAPAGP